MAVNADNKGGKTVIFTCAGAPHCGQVANAAGMLLHQEGAGTLVCATAIAAENPDILKQARNAARRVVIDGCDQRCCSKVLAKAGLSVDFSVAAVDLGVQMEPCEPCLIVDTKKVVDHVHGLLGRADA